MSGMASTAIGSRGRKPVFQWDSGIDHSENLIRCSIGFSTTSVDSPIWVLEVLEELGLNLTRSYFDLFEDDSDLEKSVSILSFYLTGSDGVDSLEKKILEKFSSLGNRNNFEKALDSELATLIRNLSDPDAGNENKRHDRKS